MIPLTLRMKLDQILNPWLLNSKEYAAGKTFEYVMEKYGYKREEILRLAGNESTLGVSPKALEAAKAALPESNFYDEPASEPLVEALEKKFQQEGFDLNQVGVVVGNGMDSVIDHILMLFANSSASVINLPPTFIYYQFVMQRLGIEVIDVPRKLTNDGALLSYEIDLAAVKNSVKANTKLVFLCTPNNPDGGITEKSLIEDLAKFLLERNIILFVDHAYIDFSEKKYNATDLIKKYPNIVIGFTFSKAYALAGFRVGYALVSKEIQKQYFSHMTPFLCSRASIAAAKAALADQEHLSKIVESNKVQRELLKDKFLELGFEVFNTQSNFYLIRPGVELSKKLSEDWIASSPSAPCHDTLADYLLEKLMSKAIIIRAMKSVSPSSLRVTIGTAEENQRLLKALTEII